MTLNNTLPQRFTKIDDLTRSDHRCLTDDDACYFILKKPMDRCNKQLGWECKKRGDSAAADAFGTILNSGSLDH